MIGINLVWTAQDEKTLFKDVGGVDGKPWVVDIIGFFQTSEDPLTLIGKLLMQNPGKSKRQQFQSLIRTHCEELLGKSNEELFKKNVGNLKIKGACQ